MSREKLSEARISQCGEYRYTLTRTWDSDKPTVVFVMLNPSTADADQDDPTIRRCVFFAKKFGYGSLIVINLFALRATSPNDLYQHHHPVGPDNGWAWLDVLDKHKNVICAWGNLGTFNEQNRKILNIMGQAGCVSRALKINKSRQPSHPLYLPNDCTLVPYEG